MKTIEYTRPWMAAYQLKAIFHRKRYGIVEASTKSGKTHACIIWLFEKAAAGSEGQQRWWVAPVYSQAKIAYRRLRRALHQAIPGYFHSNSSDLTITLANGAVIAFKSAENPDNLYGDDVYDAVIDEASRCREESWHAIRSTLTHTRGMLRIIGNVKGRKNWAYRMARQAESGDPDMHFARITAYDAVEAGILAASEIEDARKQLPEAVFKELYLAEPSDDGGNPFGMGAIQRCVVEGLSPMAPSAWGWDLAKSVDWTVGIGLDYVGQVSRFERFQRPWGATVKAIDQATGSDRALVDSTGVGDPIVERLQAECRGYYTGYSFSQSSKQKLMEGLAVAIQQGDVAYPDGPIVRELEAFEYEYTRTGVRYTAPEGMHDDCVMALALAVQCAATAGFDGRADPPPQALGYAGGSDVAPRREGRFDAPPRSRQPVAAAYEGGF